MVANSSFLEKEEHLVTFLSMVAKTRMNYFLRKGDKGLCKDCKVVRENLNPQHKLLVMNLEMERKRKKRVLDDCPRIKRSILTNDQCPRGGGEVSGGYGAGGSGSDVDSTLDLTFSCIVAATKEVLGGSKGRLG